MKLRHALSSICALALALLLGVTPVAAQAKTASPARRKLMSLVREQRARTANGSRMGARAAALPPIVGEPPLPGPSYVAGIRGRVATTSGYWEDADVIVGAFMYDEEFDDWWPVEIGEVRRDGTYEMGLEETGTYRVGFADMANVYAEVYYKDATSTALATDVPVSAGTTVTVDQTLTALPEYLVSGRIAFVGAEPPSGDVSTDDVVEAFALQYDADWEDWWPVTYALVRPDGSYRVHLPEAATVRMGFYDWSGVFAPVLYKDAETPEEATDVVVPDEAHPATGIDQTMTAMPTRRIGGAGRYDTAVEISRETFPDGWAPSVVIATGENWPDAAVAGPLAAFNTGPLLLTRRTSLPESVAEELMRLQPYEVVIIGGYGAVSFDVEYALRTQFGVPLVRRIAGRDRYETAELVAEEMFGLGGGPVDPAGSVSAKALAVPDLVFATGERFPDSIAAGSLASSAWSPLLFVTRDTVPAPTRAFILRHTYAYAADASFPAPAHTSSVVVGGPAAISDDVLEKLPNATRVSGADRYATAAAVASYGASHSLMGTACVGIASGATFADGLVAAPALALDGRPLLLTRPDTLSTPTRDYVVGNHVARALVFGNELGVWPGTFDQIVSAVETP